MRVIAWGLFLCYSNLFYSNLFYSNLVVAMDVPAQPSLLVNKAKLCEEALREVAMSEPFLSAFRATIARELGVTQPNKQREPTVEEVRTAFWVLQDLRIPQSEKLSILDVYLDKQVEKYLSHINGDKEIREKNGIALLVQTPERGLIKEGNFPRLLTNQEAQDQSFDPPPILAGSPKLKTSSTVEAFIENHGLKQIMAQAMSQGINVHRGVHATLEPHHQPSMSDHFETLLYQMAKEANRPDVMKIITHISKQSFALHALIHIANDTQDESLLFETAKVTLAANLLDGTYNLYGDGEKSPNGFVVFSAGTARLDIVTFVLRQVEGKYRKEARDLLFDYIKLIGEKPGKDFSSFDVALRESLKLGEKVEGTEVRVTSGSSIDYLTQIRDPKIIALLKQLMDRIEGTMHQRQYGYGNGSQVVNDLDKGRFAIGENPKLLDKYLQHERNLSRKPKSLSFEQLLAERARSRQGKPPALEISPVEFQRAFEERVMERLLETHERRLGIGISTEEFRKRATAVLTTYHMLISNPRSSHINYQTHVLQALSNYRLAGDPLQFLAVAQEGYVNGDLPNPFMQISTAAWLQFEKELLQSGN